MGVPRGFRVAFRGFVNPASSAPPLAGTGEQFLELVSPPPSFDWRPRNILSPVRFQGNCNTCTSFASAAVIEARRRITTTQSLRLAPGFVHRCILQRACNMGSSPDEVLDAAVQTGIAFGFDGDYPFPPERCTTAPRFRIQRWGWIERVPDILGQVANEGPVLADLEIDETFLSLKAGQIYRVQPGAPTVLHTVAVVGFDVAAGWALIQNSLGTGWSDQGFGRIAIGTGNFLSPRGAYRIAA